jgi:hypothetical protein
MLSAQQRAVLRWLLRSVRTLEGRDDIEARIMLRDGIRWRPSTVDEESENCWRASPCRTLARLEKRGLITRLRGPKNARTIAVMFTDVGRRVAEALSA